MQTESDEEKLNFKRNREGDKDRPNNSSALCYYMSRSDLTGVVT